MPLQVRSGVEKVATTLRNRWTGEDGAKDGKKGAKKDKAGDDKKEPLTPQWEVPVAAPAPAPAPAPPPKRGWGF